MNNTSRALGHAALLRTLLGVALALAVLGDAPALGQERDAAEPDAAPATTAQRQGTSDTRGPARTTDPGQSVVRPWYFTATAGPAWFGGDDVSDATSFAGQVRLARDLSDEAYLVGSYLFAMPETETDTAGGGTDEDSHDLHAFTFGAGLRGDVTQEVQLFIEPRAGVLFGSDIDAAFAFTLAGGVDFRVTEGVAVRFEVTGLLTDAEIDTGGADANLESGFLASFGVSFEF